MQIFLVRSHQKTCCLCLHSIVNVLKVPPPRVESRSFSTLISLQGLKWIVLQWWLYSFSLNIALGSPQLFGLYFATTNLWREARGHPSSWDFIAGFEESWNPRCCTVFPPLMWDSVWILKLQHWGWLQIAVRGLSLQFTDAYFALQLVDSGAGAQTHTEGQITAVI